MSIETELLEIKKSIENGNGISYGELCFLQEHQDKIKEMQDIFLAEWSGISEEEWNK